MNKKIFNTLILFFILDQASKTLVDMYIKKDINIFGNILEIVKVNNTGAAFSILENNTVLLILISFVMLFILIRYIDYFKNIKNYSLYIGVLLGGILGNLSDRLFLGSVRDFISINLFNINFPIFNMADIFIVVATLILLISSMGVDINDFKSSRRRCK